MLELCGLHKTYKRADGTPVMGLAEVSLKVEPGEFVAVRGPSGCGKTTLLLTCGALLSPDAGTVTLDGVDLYCQSPEARARFCAKHIGFVFQQFHLIPYLDLRENVLLPALASSRADAVSRAEALIERFGLQDRVEHVPAELSTGERQRAGLARALLNEPDLILADEPTGNLDTESSEVVLQALTEFARSGGTVLMVTHESAAAERAARVLSMRAGRLEA